jgi:hypothetical protein
MVNKVQFYFLLWFGEVYVLEYSCFLVIRALLPLPLPWIIGSTILKGFSEGMKTLSVCQLLGQE